MQRLCPGDNLLFEEVALSDLEPWHCERSYFNVKTKCGWSSSWRGPAVVRPQEGRGRSSRVRSLPSGSPHHGRRSAASWGLGPPHGLPAAPLRMGGPGAACSLQHGERGVTLPGCAQLCCLTARLPQARGPAEPGQNAWRPGRAQGIPYLRGGRVLGRGVYGECH